MSPYRELDLNVRERDKRRAYLEAHVFELLIAIMAALAAASFFIDPAALEHSPIGRTLHPFDYAWNALYLAGGALTAAGLARPSYDVERAGLAFLSSAIAAAGLAAITAGGSTPSSIGIHLAAAAACVVRLRAMRRLERAVEEVDEELARRQPDRRRRR